MTEFFNEYGTPNKEINDFSQDLYRNTLAFFYKLVEKGATPVEIRAAARFISGSVNFAESFCIMNTNREKEAKKREAKMPREM